MSELFELFRNSIAEEFHIDREGKNHFPVENEVGYTFRSPSEMTIGFKVEQENLKLFSKYPSLGIGKSCDALFVVRYKGKDFIIAVEIKSMRAYHYKKQLLNGCRLCEWLVQLFKDHEHYSYTPEYLGLLIRSGNPGQINKIGTAAGGNFKENSDTAAEPLNKIFTFKQTTICLRKFLQQAT